MQIKTIVIPVMKFNIGRLVITRGAEDVLSETDINTSLQQFCSCDWGVLAEADKPLNDEAVKSGDDMIMGAYLDSNGKKFYIKTEWDRSVTTIYLAGED